MYLIAVFFIVIPPASKGEDTAAPVNEAFPSYISKTLPKNLLIGMKNSVTGWNLALLGIGAGTALTLSQTDADEDVQSSLKGSIGDFAEIGDIGGSAVALAGITVASYITAKSIKDEKLLQTSEALIEAEILTAVTTSAIKLSVGRERPDGSGSRFTSSFPSGHVSGSFAMASVFDVMYGHKAGFPLYAFSAFVGLSRISDNKHFLSDVLFGAALGTAVGRGVAKIHKKEKRGNFTVIPYSDGRSTGLALALTW